jgi:hypothetical protein
MVLWMNRPVGASRLTFLRCGKQQANMPLTALTGKRVREKRDGLGRMGVGGQEVFLAFLVGDSFVELLSSPSETILSSEVGMVAEDEEVA